MAEDQTSTATAEPPAQTADATAQPPTPTEEQVEELTSEEWSQTAPKEPVGDMLFDKEHFEELRDGALMQMTRQAAKSIKFNERLERRHAAKEPVDTAVRVDVAKSEQERLVAQEKAAAEAAERASKWIAPDVVEGTTDEVTLVISPPVEQRKMTMHIRALGQIDDGFIMVFENPPDPADPKLGRVAESERFGTKNRIRAAIDPKTGMADEGKVHTHLGYKDFGPLRLTPGDYVVVVVDMDDGVLAKEEVTILPDWDGDGQSDQVYNVRSPRYLESEPRTAKSPREQAIAKAERRGEEPQTVGSNEETRATAAEQQIAREKARTAGEDVPPAPGSGPAPKPTKEEKAAAKDSPEARAQKG